MTDSIMGMGSESTIQEYITQYKSEEIVSHAFFLKQVFSSNGKKMLVNYNNLILKYMPELKSLKVKVTLTDEEYAKYRYNPKRLSYDIYGTTELWFMILELNELRSISEFNLRTIYLFDTSIVSKVIRILNLEIDSKNYNEEEIAADLLS